MIRLVVYKGIGELKRINGNTQMKQIVTTGSSYHLVRDLGTKLKLAEPRNLEEGHHRF